MLSVMVVILVKFIQIDGFVGAFSNVSKSDLAQASNFM